MGWGGGGGVGGSSMKYLIKREATVPLGKSKYMIVCMEALPGKQ